MAGYVLSPHSPSTHNSHIHIHTHTYIYSRRPKRKEKFSGLVVCIYTCGLTRTSIAFHVCFSSLCADQCRGVVGHGHDEACGNVKRVMYGAIGGGEDVGCTCLVEHTDRDNLCCPFRRIRQPFYMCARGQFRPRLTYSHTHTPASCRTNVARGSAHASSTYE